MTSALILADTHVPRFRRELPAELAPHLAGCDIVLHAGDVTDPAVLDRLAAHAPVLAVLGNADGPEVAAWGAVERLEMEIGGVAVAMVHDAGPARGRPGRLRRWFPAAELVVYGHSHIPAIERDGGRILVNPGSPTWKRRQPHPTVAIARLARGHVDVTLVALGQLDAAPHRA
jgi:putative phosphoesterase